MLALVAMALSSPDVAFFSPPTTAHMLARAAEQDRRRELRQRQLRASRTPSEERTSWLDRIRQASLRLAGTAA